MVCFHEDERRVACKPLEAARVGGVGGERLLAQHVLACAQRSRRPFIVLPIDQRNVHSVDGIARDDLCIRAAQRDVPPVGESLGARGRRGTHGND